MNAYSFNLHRIFLIGKGYDESELYATTYSDNGITPFFSFDIKCKYVKQVNFFF